MNRRPLLPALLSARCPRCRTGAFFSHGPYDLRHLAAYHSHCPHCGLQFEPEPGFFWGAIYFNYAFIVGTLLVTYLTLELNFDRPPVWVEMAVFLGLVVVLFPLFLRVSRLLMLFLFAGHKYDPSAQQRSDSAPH